MQTLVVGREITAGGAAIIIFPIDADSGAETVAIASRPDKLKRQPVIAVSSTVLDYDRPSVQNPDHRVHEPVVVQIAERNPSARYGLSAMKCGHLEPPPDIFREEGSFFVG